jgi:hypothetical protein
VIPKDCKRLVEVDFPIAVVSKHSEREKSIRHGHPSTLHLWWARAATGLEPRGALGALVARPVRSALPRRLQSVSLFTHMTQGFSRIFTTPGNPQAGILHNGHPVGNLGYFEKAITSFAGVWGACGSYVAHRHLLPCHRPSLPSP